jgi:hypothetical protein
MIKHVFPTRCRYLVILTGVIATGLYAKKELAPSATQAIATFEKGYVKTGLGTGNNQFYSRAYDESCATLKGVAKFAPLSGSSKIVPLDAGKQHIIRAVTNYYQSTGTSYTGSGVGINVGSRTCENQVRFSPKPMARYSIVQRADSGMDCKLDVVDLETGKPVEDITIEKFEVCSKAMKKQ